MRRGRRFPVLTVVILLLVGIATVSVFVAVAALPLVLLVASTGIALVVGLGTRVSRASRRGRARGASAARPGGGHDDAVVEPSAETSGRRWVTQWESGPPASALSFVRGRLTVMSAEWGVPDEAIEPTLLVVTELVSNAVDHAHAPVRLVVEFLGESVRVEVHDGTSEAPRLQPHDPFGARGRGLQMVEALSTRWGWDATSDGKVVWAEVLLGWPEERTPAAPGVR